MLLYLQDWARFPEARPNWETKNTSWIQLAKKYQIMGIQNYTFILALINQDLKGIDPFDENLTEEQMAEVAIECFQNPWFFFRECIRVPAQAGSGTSFLSANRGNIALWWCFFNHVLTILIQIRQTGKSLSVDCLMTLLLNVLCRNTNINLLTKDDDLRRQNIKRLKDIGAELPDYLKRGTKADINNGEEISIKALGNYYNTHVPQSSEKRANNLGRGITSPIIHIDEPPFQPNIRIAFPAMITATNAVFDEAKAKGEPYGILLTTTAGKKDDKDGRYVYAMVQDAYEWTEKLFDCKDEEDLRRVIKIGSRRGDYMVNITLNHRQLGKTDEWLREKIRTARGDPESIRRDYFNEWTSGSQKSPFSSDVAEKIASSRQEPEYIYISDKYGYALRFYIPEYKVHSTLVNNKLVLGIDPSDIGGGDDLGFYLTDSKTLDTIAVGTFNESNLYHFTEWLADFLTEYTNITLNIERRSSGAAILDHLFWLLPRKGADPFKRIFNRVVNDYLEYPERYKEILVPLNRRPEDIYVRHKTAFGWSTSGSGLTSRSALYSITLNNGIRLAGSRLKDKQLIDQILALEIRNGRVDHPEGGHDDIAISWLLAVWLLTQGTNLSFYGLEPTDVLTRAKELEVKDPIVYQRQIEQQRLRAQIESLCDELSKEKDDMIASKIEAKIRVLEHQIVFEDGEVNSIDELIRKAREKKKQNIRARQNANTISYMNQYNQGYNYFRPFY